MRFYHNSNQILTELTPKIGGSRHKGEDPRAVGKPVIWLSNQPQIDQPPKKYRYLVEIDLNDPLLFMDESFDKLQKDLNSIIQGSDNGWRWYFYIESLQIIKTLIFDPTLKDYIE